MRQLRANSRVGFQRNIASLQHDQLQIYPQLCSCSFDMYSSAVGGCQQKRECCSWTEDTTSDRTAAAAIYQPPSFLHHNGHVGSYTTYKFTHAEQGLAVHCPRVCCASPRAVRDFVFVKEIGTGNASTVWYAFCKKTSAPLAIKTYKKRKLSPLNRCQVAREINIHSQLDHPNVIALVS
eukprot:GHUV01008503.1.p1 GENE.GHUV01008503.1~~GHUV01008503.1.p1  ORF type:complete len:179 (+),score=30.49 GHUV01008503.1:873-1409(+)